MKPLLLLLFFVEINAAALSQINPKDATAQVITYWSLHEKQEYTYTYLKQEITNSDTLTSIDIIATIAIEIIDSTAQSFTINWTYNNVQSRVKTEASNWISTFLNQQEIVFEINELGVFQKIIEPKLFKNKLSDFTSKLANFNDAGTDRCLFLSYFDEKQGIGLQEMRAIYQFHNFHGLEYVLQEQLKGKLKEAETVNSIVVPGTIEVKLETLLPEKKTMVLRSIKTLDAAAFATAMNDSPNNANLYNNTTTTLSVLHVSGWIILSNQLKIVDLPAKKVIEESVLKMNEF